MKFLRLFVQEFEVCSALIFDVFDFIRFVFPVGVGLPFVILFLLIVVADVEVLLFGSLFAICTTC